jgi:DNA-binding MarR family transcriptional regulator
MADSRETALINDFLGSAHMFALAIGNVIEEKLWTEAAGEQLTVTQLRLLKLVSHPGSTHTITDVGTFLGISNAAASKAVDKLVRLMLIKRTEGESDRRAIHLSLTGPGRKLLEAYDAAVSKKLGEVFGQIQPDEMQPVMQFLDRLASDMMNHRQVETGGVCVLCGIYFREKCPLRSRFGRRCLYLQARSSGKANDEPPPASKPRGPLYE